MPQQKRRRRRRRKRSREAKRPLSNLSIVLAAGSAVSVLFLITLILITAGADKSVPQAVSGSGVLWFIASLLGSWAGIRQMKDESLSYTSRLLGLIAPVISTVCWAGLYLLGILFG